MRRSSKPPIWRMRRRSIEGGSSAAACSFAELACASVGWDGLRPFVEDLLCVERFRGLVRVEREMGG